jgi:hypothetical protein
MWHRSAIVANVVAATTLACATPRANFPILERGWQPRAVYVTVANTGFYSANVYACNGGQRIRIGFVVGGSTTVIPVRNGLFADGRVQLYVQLVGAMGNYLSDKVMVNNGGRAILSISRELPQSTLTPLAQ